MSALVSLVVVLIVSAIVILIVGKLNLGLEVSGFGGDFVAALVIAIVGGLVAWLLNVLGITFGGGLLGALAMLVVAALVLMVSDKFAPGMKVNGFGGAIIAAIAIGVVTWVVNWLISLVF